MNKTTDFNVVIPQLGAVAVAQIKGEKGLVLITQFEPDGDHSLITIHRDFIPDLIDALEKVIS